MKDYLVLVWLVIILGVIYIGLNATNFLVKGFDKRLVANFPGTRHYAIICFFILAILIPGYITCKYIFYSLAKPVIEICYFLAYLSFNGAMLVVSVNVYRHYIRPAVHRFRHGSLEIYKRESPIRVISSFLVLVCALCHPPSFKLGLSLLFLYFIDPAGLPSQYFSAFRQIVGHKRSARQV